MKKLKRSDRTKRQINFWIGGCVAAVYAAYAAIVFSCCKAEQRGAAFWISFAALSAGYLLSATLCLATRDDEGMCKDYFFHLHLMKHSVIYVALELAAATLFICLGPMIAWQWTLGTQVVLLVAYAFLAGSCFVAKLAAEQAEETVLEKTRAIKQFRAEARIVCSLAHDADTRRAYEKVCEKLNFSDPVSDPLLQGVEEEIREKLKQARRAVEENDLEQANRLANALTALIEERNVKTFIGKKR